MLSNNLVVHIDAHMEACFCQTSKCYGGNDRHMVNMANQNAHKALRHWNYFWAQLKNIEGLLLVQERRQRFVNTCEMLVDSTSREISPTPISNNSTVQSS